MKTKSQNVFWLSIFRRPLMSLLILLAIGFVSFGFVGKAVETIIVWRETNRLEGYYRSIGAIYKDFEGEEHLFSEGAAIIEQSPAFAFGDFKRQTAGFMQDIYNVDFDTGTMDVGETLYADASLWYGEGVYNLDYWFYGTLVDSQILKTNKKPVLTSGYLLVFEVDEVLAGYPERVQPGERYVVWVPVNYTIGFEKIEVHLKEMRLGQRYLIRAWSHPTFPFSVTGVNAVNLNDAFNLKALDDKDLWYIPAEKDESIDLSLSKYEGIRLEIDRLNENLRSILLIGTSDMSALPEVQLDSKYFFLVEGRWLNREDEEQAKPVIVIAKNLAETRGIGIGNQITFTLRALKDPYHSYIRGEEDIRHWRDYPSKTVSYEVVGIYSHPGFEQSYFKQNWFSNAYVPNSTLPDDFIHTMSWSAVGDKTLSYSFVLTDPRLQDAFLEEYSPKLKARGFDLSFVENNAKNFVAGADPLRKSLLMGAVLFAVALLMAIVLSVFLYLRQQRRNYAVLRALGVPARISNKQLILPLLGLGLLGSVIGALFSWQNAHNRAAESLSKLPLPSGVLPELSLHPALGVGIWFLVLLMIVLTAWLGNRKVTSAPVLELLQDNIAKKQKRVFKDLKAENLTFNKNLISKITQTPSRGKSDSKRALSGFYRSNLLRSPVKSLLTVVVAATLLLALGWFQTLIESNKLEVDRLYKSFQVQIDFFIKSENMLNLISRKGVDWVEQSGVMDHSYLSTLMQTRFELNMETGSFEPMPPYRILALNHLEHGLERSIKGMTINFLPGYGPESFTEKWLESEEGLTKLPLVIPEEILSAEGWQLGDELIWEFFEFDKPVTFVVVGSSVGGSTVYGAMGRNGWQFGPYSYMLTNLSAIETYFSTPPNYAEVAFYSAPEMNYQLKAFKSELLAKQEETTWFPATIHFWDEELLAVVEPMEQNLSLMERLYPVTLLLAGSIGGVLCLLLVLNQAKETALLRMLGVEKRQIRRMQMSQIVLLSVIGLIVGLVVLIVLRTTAAARWSLGVAGGIYLAGAFLGALVGNILVAGKKPMELLQVKE